VFGPGRNEARIEGSKSFAKEIMERCNVPTAKWRLFGDYREARDFVKSHSMPVVVKADGLAAGKGVTVCFDRAQAFEALKDCFERNTFGEAGKTVVIEEYLHGEEVSVLCFSDGTTVLPMTPAQDYKRAFDHNEGPNTGGMGSYSPVPALSERVFSTIIERIMKPVIRGLAEEGAGYKGVLYGGIVLTDQGPKVLEFNVRFGDPETQAVLPRLKSDLVEIMLAAVEGRLDTIEIDWSKDKCVTVVLASGGYPGNYRTSVPIRGLKAAAREKGVDIFHAGTEVSAGHIVTAGGRVLNVCGRGRTFEEARRRAYGAVDQIKFDGAQYRTDIGLRAAKHEAGVAINHRAVQDFRSASPRRLDV
ncbi:MAG: phosphoribosylamine--glycine ligase, partial [Terriglobia bacterium]